MIHIRCIFVLFRACGLGLGLDDKRIKVGGEGMTKMLYRNLLIDGV